MAKGVDPALLEDADVLALEYERRRRERERREGLIDPGPTCYDFEMRWRPRLEGRVADFDAYSHHVEVYQDMASDLAIMAGAQGGKTRRLMAAGAHGALSLQSMGNSTAYFYPDDTTRTDNSRRFEEYIKSIPRVRPLVGAGSDGIGGLDGIERRSVGAAPVYFRLIGGRSSTESIPVFRLIFDELRRMRPSLVQLATERTSGQVDPTIIKASTAGAPNSDIHAAFQAGDQRFFHSDCRCPDGVSLSEVFPDCVVDLQGATPELRRHVAHASMLAGVPYCGVDDATRARYGEGVLMCPRCGSYLLRPRDGWWQPRNPGSVVRSYQFSQMLSPIMSGPRLAQKVHRPPAGYVDMGTLVRDVAGMPYLGTDDLGVTREVLVGMVRSELVWAANMGEEWRRQWMVNCAMGIDHMKGYNCVWIKQMAPNGKARTVHAEVVAGDNPWVRCGQLMEEYDVACCCIEEGPNYNEALRFADVFKGRVYLVHYGSAAGDLARWTKPGSRLRGEELQSQRFVVTVNQDRALEWSMGRMRARLNEFPPPRGLVQKLKKKEGRVVFSPLLRDGSWDPAYMLEEVLWPHLEAVSFQKRFRDGADDMTIGARYDREYVPIGFDPHFALAGMFADLALMQIGMVAADQDYAAPSLRDEATGQEMTEDEIRRLLLAQAEGGA